MSLDNRVSTRLTRSLVFSAIALAVTCQSRRGEANEAASTIRELRYDLPVDVSIIAVNVGFIVVAGAADWGPTECKWCERSDLNDVDRWFRDELKTSSKAAEVFGGATSGLSLISAFGWNAFGALSTGQGAETMGVDALIVLEAASVATSLTTVSKIIFGRQRPYVLDLSEAEFAARPPSTDDNASFFSGHTSLAFSLAVSSGMVASLRGYRIAPLVWTSGLTLATLAGSARIMQDQHYFTDLLTGAAVGSAVGFAIPYLLHQPLPVSLSAAPLEGGGSLLVQGQW